MKALILIMVLVVSLLGLETIKALSVDTKGNIEKILVK